MIITLKKQKVNDADGIAVACWVVLRDYGAGANQRYVTHMWSESGGYFWGNYFSELSKAEKDYTERFNKWAVGEYRYQLSEEGPD